MEMEQVETVQNFIACLKVMKQKKWWFLFSVEFFDNKSTYETRSFYFLSLFGDRKNIVIDLQDLWMVHMS
jgi:hypothetical protein